MLRTWFYAALAALLAAACLAAPAGAASDCPTDPSARGAQGVQGDTNVDQAKSATLLFIPGPVRTPEPDLTAYLEQLPGYSVALFSPTLGRYSPTQMMLDISQGARVASSLYTPVAPASPGLVVNGTGGGAIDPWQPFVKRADDVPGDIVPGLLGCALAQAGRSVAWFGFDDSPTITSIAAASAAGVIPGVGNADPASQASALLAAQRHNDLLVAALPAGGPGLGVARTLAARTPERLILIVQAPPEPARTRLLTFAAHGLGGSGGLKSATTRRNGLVAATDFAPTILKRLQVELPKDMNGQPVVGTSKLSAAELGEMNDRLALIAGRRGPLGQSVILLGGLAALMLMLLGWAAGRRRETARLTERMIGLAVMWLPLMLLAGAALRPARATEALIVVAGGLLLALLTDRLVPWPRALYVPALVVVVAHGFDFLLLDGKLTGESLLGSNPLYGARFFGVGNELEAVITVSCVMGAGSFLADTKILYPARWFAGIGVALALFLGAGRLGADVGGVIFAGAAFGIAALYVAKMKFTPLRVALLVLLPILGLVLIAGLDAVTGGESHLTRTVFEAQGFGDLWKVADRRFSASINGAKTGGVWIIMLVAIAVMIWGWIRRERIFSRLTEDGEDPIVRRPLRAGMAGALGGTIIGALANDSGPAILIIGTIYMCMGLLYLRGRPISGTIEG
ncbi:MAG: hypothetical protein QM648_08155 [Solirubrobacterales bacterium]